MAENVIHVEVIYQGILKKGTPLDDSGKAKKSFLKRSPGWKDKYFVLYLKEEEDQNTYAFIAFHEKKPQNATDEPKGVLKLWPHYRVDKKFDPKAKQHIFEVKTPQDTYRLMAETQPTMDLWVFYLQIQTKLRADFPGDTFEVIPDDSEEMRRIGAKSSKCLVNISKWGITLALKKTKSVVAQWPLKSIRGFESSDDGRFKFDAGRNSPMGQGNYLFKTQPEQDNKMFDLMDEYTTAAAQAEKIASPQGGPPQPPSDEEVATQYQSLRLATFGLLPQRKISGPGMATSCISIPGAQNQRTKYDRLQRKQSYGTENDVSALSRNNSGRGASAHRSFNGADDRTPPPLPPPRDGSLPHDEMSMPADVVRPKDFPRRLPSEHMYPHEPPSPLKDYPDGMSRGRPADNVEMNHYQTPPPVHYMSPRNSILSHRSSITSENGSILSDRRDSYPIQGAVGGPQPYATMGGMPRSASSSSMKAYYEAMMNAKPAAIVQQVCTPSPYENALTGSYENAPLISPGFYFSPAHPHSNQGFLISPLSPHYIGMIPGMVPLAIPTKIQEVDLKGAQEDVLEGAVGGVAEPDETAPQLPKSLSEVQFTKFSKDRERLHRQVSVPYASVNRDKQTDAELGYIDMKKSIGIDPKVLKKSPSLDALLDSIATSSLQDESPLIGSLDLAKSISPGSSMSKPSWFGSRRLPLPPELLDGNPNAYTEMADANVKTVVYSKTKSKSKADSSHIPIVAYEDIEPTAAISLNRTPNVLSASPGPYEDIEPTAAISLNRTPNVLSASPGAYEDIENLNLKTDETGYLYSDFQKGPPTRKKNNDKLTRTQSNPNLLNGMPQDEYCEVLNLPEYPKNVTEKTDKAKLKKSLSNPNLIEYLTDFTKVKKTNFTLAVKPASHFSGSGNNLAQTTPKKKFDKKPEKKPKPKRFASSEKNIASAKGSVEVAAGISTSSKTKSFSKHGGGRSMQRSLSQSSTGELQAINATTNTSTAILSNRPLPGTPDNQLETGSMIQTRPLPHIPGNLIAENDPDWV